MISCKDFVPKQTSKSGFFKAAVYEDFESAVQDMNQFIEDNPHYTILNIETVVLPNIHSPREEGSQDTSLRTAGEIAAHWHQFVRVWYRQK